MGGAFFIPPGYGYKPADPSKADEADASAKKAVDDAKQSVADAQDAQARVGSQVSRLEEMLGSAENRRGDWSLLPLIVSAMSDRISNVESQVNDLIGDVEKKNRDAELCRQWKQLLGSHRPTDADGKISSDEMSKYIEEFKKTTGLDADPFTYFGMQTMKHYGGEYKQSDVDQMIESLKSYESSVSSDQSMMQFQLQRAVHNLDAAVQLLSSVEKALDNVLQSVERAIG